MSVSGLDPQEFDLTDFQRAAEGGGKLRGGKTYRKFGEKPLPENVFGPPHLRYVFPPLFWRLSVISLKRKRHRPDQPQFPRPPKVVLESTLCSTFPPPPPNSRDTFSPPLSRCQEKSKDPPIDRSGSQQGSVLALFAPSHGTRTL